MAASKSGDDLTPSRAKNIAVEFFRTTFFWPLTLEREDLWTTLYPGHDAP